MKMKRPHGKLVLGVALAVMNGLVIADIVDMGEAKAELKASAENISLMEDLSGPDGAAFEFTADGGWRLYGYGSASYDFNSADDIQDATKEAVLQAKANMAKFVREKISTEIMVNTLTEKRKHLAKGQDAQVSRDSVKTTVETIKNSAEEILRGAITLTTDKVPAVQEGGAVRVKVGVSSKTLKAAGEIAGAISGNLQNKPSAGAVQAGGSTGDSNVQETRRSKSDF